MSTQDKTLQTVSIALIVIAIAVSGISLNSLGGIRGRIDDVEELSTSISGDVGNLASAIDSLTSVIEDLSDRPVPSPSPSPGSTARSGTSSPTSMP